MLRKFTTVATWLCLALLWFRLIDHLQVEWTLNPQYAYGWAVPGLCVLLLWRRRTKVEDGSWELEKEPAALLPSSNFHLPSPLRLAATALAYGATRLIAEANPDWRLVSWSLALEVIAITLLLLRLNTLARSDALTLPRSSFPLPSPLFPLLFFLVAVPWPTLIETPVIQVLSRANAATAVEVLGWFSVPALQHGNVLEVSAGMVGIDDACSGIRSLQATLMLSLFFGEFYRLKAWRRVGCVAAGFILSLLFNVVRTTLLTAVAAGKGIAAIAHWHDPAGVAILLGCFLAVWALARRGRKKRGERRQGADFFALLPPLSSLRPFFSASQRFSFSAFLLLAWFVATELGVEWWYRSHEQNLQKPVAWAVELPRDKTGFREMPLSEKTQQFLRYDEGINARWIEQGCGWQAIFLRWNPGRIAARMALGHTPQTCLTAAGRDLVCASEPRTLDVNGVLFPVRLYTFRGEGGPVRVLYCLRQERAGGLNPESLTWRTRLAAVMSGTRNTGQRALELALWGATNEQEGYAALERQFLRLVRVQALGDQR